MRTLLIGFVILFVLLILCSSRGRESMTRILRGVGQANEADEVTVASGIITSAPLMDYTHTYWDGNKFTSCDECPNSVVCPGCPQFRENFYNPNGGLIQDKV